MSATPGGVSRVDHHRGPGELPTSRAAQVVVAGPSAPHVRGDHVDLSPLWRRMRVLATIEDPVVVRKILTHLGLPTEASAPRPPPSDLFDCS